MNKMKQVLSCVSGSLLMFSGPAMADGFQANVGAVSEYLFRGIEESQGAAIQGEAYYVWDEGFYAGAWLTNARSSSNKVDIYAGYETQVGQFSLGGGLVYRYYSEDQEHSTLNPQGGEIDFPELFVTAGVGPLGLTIYHTNDYFGTGSDGTYLNGEMTLPLMETVTLVAQCGLNFGAGVELMRGEEYMDYSLTLEKQLEDELTVMAQVVDTDRDVGTKDDPKFVVGIRKDFSL